MIAPATTISADLLSRFSRFARVPGALVERSQWVCYRIEQRPKGPTKIPVNANTGGNASATDPRSWCDYATALEAHASRKLAGVGFVFTRDDTFCGVDLDNCIDDAGTMAPWATAIVNRLNTYTEISPSGHGVKLFAYGALPECGRRKGGFGDGTGKIELYTAERFFTVTGRHLEGTPQTITDCSDQLLCLYRELFTEPRRPTATRTPTLGPVTSDDSAIIDKVKQDSKAARLWSGNTAGYGSGSEADLALCGRIAFFAGNNPARIDSIFRRSDLCRDKWTEREDYRDRTIAKALDGKMEFYDWNRRNGNGNGNGKDRSTANRAEPAPDLPPSGSFGSEPGGGFDDFGEPQALPAELVAVEPFEFALLPDAFRPWIQDIADRVQCPPDFPAIAAMIGLASIVGRTVGIRPKQHDDWHVVPNLWGVAIGRPGIMKTPALQEPLKPLKRLEVEAQKRFAEVQKDYDLLAEIAAAEAKARKKQIEECVAKGGDVEAAARKFETRETQPPTRQRYLVNDSTVEKLGELLNENDRGLLCYRDELIGMLKSLDKEGQEGARAFYLEAWNGTGRFTWDRIGRGTTDIAACCISIIGGIQPGPLAEYQRSAAMNGAGDDGLLQRFQLAVWPDVATTWKNVDRWPNTTARDAAFGVYAQLDGLDPESIGAEKDPHDYDAIPFLRFAHDAQVVFDDWRAELEEKVRSQREHPAIESHLAKYRSLIPSLALLIHLADGGTGPVGLRSLTKAIAWGHYLESYARRIFGDTIDPGPAAARALARKIDDGSLATAFSLKDVYRPGWSRLKTSRGRQPRHRHPHQARVAA